MHIATRQLEGRDHYVVPVVMIVEGVHKGSQGPVYYPAAELRRSAQFWDGKPAVIYHPTQYGASYAGSPEVFNRQKVGTVFNTRFDGKRLVAEAWIDVVRVGQVDTRVEQAILRRAVVEVSTGLTIDLGTEPGVWNGKSYHTTARRMSPDHLAILPDQRGACSVADGAGLCRNEQWAAAPPSATLAATGYSYAPWQPAATALAVANENNDDSPLVMPGVWD